MKRVHLLCLPLCVAATLLAQSNPILPVDQPLVLKTKLSSNSSQATGRALYTFTGGSDGSFPFSLTSDASGNLYGMTGGGGDISNCSGLGCGVVFKLSPGSSGGWIETVLYTFSGGADGAFPIAGLILDSAGNLYGMTNGGGYLGNGVVFELSPTSSGTWNENVLYTFTGGTDGGRPYGSLIFDSAGSLYGSAGIGGNLSRCPRNGGCGVIFELSPASGGAWQESVLYAFNGGAAGAFPDASLVFDAAGNLYSTTIEGGDFSRCQGGCGVVFELSPTSIGFWKETVLHAFTGSSDGSVPTAGLAFDTVGNLYGTTKQGGKNGWGVVFKLSPNSSGTWKETLLHTFTDGADGAFPSAGVILDAAGNLYGTTEVGGGSFNFCSAGCGVVFELSPTSNGVWKGLALHTFTGGKDGVEPFAGLIFDAAGNLYGTSQGGIPNGAGVVFKITP